MTHSFRQQTAEEVLIALRRIIRAIDLHSRVLVSRFGLTGPQLTVLKKIHADGQQPIGTLAKEISLSSATVTGIIERLEKAGLSCRVRSAQDRRQVLVSLTARGREVIARTPPMLQEHFIEQFGTLEPWEQTQILSALQRIVSMMEAKELEARPILATGPLEVSSDHTRAYLAADREADQEEPAPQVAEEHGTDALSATQDI